MFLNKFLEKLLYIFTVLDEFIQFYFSLLFLLFKKKKTAIKFEDNMKADRLVINLKGQLHTCNPCWLTFTCPWSGPSQGAIVRGLLQGHWANHSLTNKLSPADVVLSFLLSWDSAPFRSRSHPMRDIWGPVTGRQMLWSTEQAPHLLAVYVLISTHKTRFKCFFLCSRMCVYLEPHEEQQTPSDRGFQI